MTATFQAFSNTLRFCRADSKDDLPMGIAGLWTRNRKATREEMLSFTMLTVNADGQALF